MTQGRLFLNGLIVLAAVLFVVRVYVVNRQKDTDIGESAVPVRDNFDPPVRTLELPASMAGWQEIGNGPVTLWATGTIDIGGQTATPGKSEKPGDEAALAPALGYGILLARIGEDGKPFKAGSITKIAAKEKIYVAINDSSYDENQGFYVVTIKKGIDD
jgi:hypothetical protein